jgi:outer membrane protein TolC
MSRILRGSIVACLALGSVTTLVAQSDVITLDDAIAAARSSNRSIANARLEVAKAGDEVSILRRKRYPVLDMTLLANQPLTALNFEFKRGVFGTYPDVGPLPGEDTKVKIARTFNIIGFARVTQPITQLYDLTLGQRIARLEEQARRERLRGAESTLRSEVTKLYSSAQQLQSSREALDESITLLEELRRVVGRYVEQQVALQSDLLEVEARLARAQQQREVVEHAILTYREQLNVAMGRPPEAPFSVSTTRASFLPDQIAAANNAEVAEAELRVEQARTDLRLERHGFYPDVAFVGTVLTPTNFDLLPRNIASAALLATWTPFDWGVRRAEVAQKARSLEQAQNAASDTRDRIAVTFNAQRRKVDESARMIEVRALDRQVAAEKLRVANEKYKHDAVLLRDVLNAEAALAEANRSADEAYLDWVTAVAELQKIAGE